MMFFSYEEEINYAHEGCDIDDSMDLVIESYINDYTIFEAVLRRDFMEATGILSEAADDNFLVRMWNKILEFIEMIKKKIIGLYDAFVAKIDEAKKKHSRSIVDKYKKVYEKSDAASMIGDFSISNFKIRPQLLAAGGEVDKLDVKSIVKMAKLAVLDIPYVDEVSKSTLEAMESGFNEFKMSDVTDEVDKMIYSDDEIKNPFSSNFNSVVKGVQSVILEKTDAIRAVKLSKREINASIENCKKDAKKKLNEIRKDKNMNKEDKEEEKSKTQTYLKVMSGMKKVVGSISSYILKIVGKLYKECVRLYTTGGKYLEGKQKSKENIEKRNKERDKRAQSLEDSYIIDLDYVNAVGEAAVYELGLGDL